MKIKPIIKSLALFALLAFTTPTWAQWDINGNPVTPGNKFGSLNNEDVDFVTNYTIDGKIRMTLKANGYVGLGTKTPDAWQEIMYCPPASQSESGLIVTLNKCNGNILTVSENVPDYIGGGIFEVTQAGSGGGETGGGILNPTFTVPFSFLTGNNTNLAQPLYSTESPMFWVRMRKPTGFNPGNSATDEFDTKFIVMPDGSCGINVVNPRAALDVRGSQAYKTCGYNWFKSTRNRHYGNKWIVPILHPASTICT